MFTRHDIDLVLLDQTELQVRFSFEKRSHLNIKGEDAAAFFAFLKNGRLTPVGPEDEFGYLGVASEQGLLMEVVPRSCENMLPPCFIPQNFDNNTYVIRVDNRLYFFEAHSAQEIVKRCEAVARACIPKEDRSVFIRVLDRPKAIELSPCNLPYSRNLTKRSDIDKCLNKINGYLQLNFPSGSKKEANLFYDSGVKLGFEAPDSQWKSIIDFCIDKQILVTLSPKRMTDRYAKRSYVPFGYASTYHMPVLEDSKYQICFGAGETPLESAGKSCMESLERYFSQRPVAAEIIASEEELSRTNRSYLSLSRLVNFLPEQIDYFKLPQVSSSGQISWSKTITSSGGSCLVPSGACHFGACVTELEKKLFFNASSNGCAAHISMALAAKAGLMECIERDAILMWWYNRLPPPAVSEETLPENIRAFLAEDAANKIEIKMLDITLDTLPVALMVCRHKSDGWPYFLCGASCADTFDEAMQRAFREFYIAFTKEHDNIPIKAREINAPIDHEKFYIDPQNAAALDFLFDGTVKSVIAPFFSTDLVKTVTEKAGEVYFHLRKECAISPDLSAYVVKTIVPGLVPISFGYFSDPLAHPRIVDIPQSLGMKTPTTSRKEMLEKYAPHFFP